MQNEYKLSIYLCSPIMGLWEETPEKQFYLKYSLKNKIIRNKTGQVIKISLQQKVQTTEESLKMMLEYGKISHVHGLAQLILLK